MLLADLPYGHREFPFYHSLEDFTAGIFHLTRRTLNPGGRAVMLYPQALVKHLRAFARAAELTLHAAYPCDTTSGRKRRLVILEVPS
ncbi:hypothetical protein AK812_SmicGene16793 [Symbiodinium microadriaticum]|uniref:Uncharacterized protein n=1 Tax=Symbiodinium microadriaticum TaxID=2951 RepID=A0A1Q9DZD4_SYMMI|nr:hypothetical protein AK812_SmicGene16793 [Symbiodinium microadriaticum]